MSLALYSRSLEINTQYYADCATPPGTSQHQRHLALLTQAHIYLLLTTDRCVATPRSSRQRVFYNPANFNPSNRGRLILCKHFAANITHVGKYNRPHTHTLMHTHTHAGDTCKALNKQTEIVERRQRRGGWCTRALLAEQTDGRAAWAHGRMRIYTDMRCI